MLYDQYCVALVPERPESAEQAVRIGGVQSGRGFVQDVKDSGKAASQLGSQARPLQFASGKGVCLAVQGQVGESQLIQETHAFVDFLHERGQCRRQGGGRFQSFQFSCHIFQRKSRQFREIVGPVRRRHGDGQGQRGKTLAPAGAARAVFLFIQAGSPAGGACPQRGVEGKMAGRKLGQKEACFRIAVAGVEGPD